jgi:hypothetical protein
VSAGHQDQRMNKDQPVSERRQREPPVSRYENRHRDEDRRDFEEPGEPIFRRDPGKDQGQDEQPEEDRRPPSSIVQSKLRAYFSPSAT